MAGNDVARHPHKALNHWRQFLKQLRVRCKHTAAVVPLAMHASNEFWHASQDGAACAGEIDAPKPSAKTPSESRASSLELIVFSIFS